MNHIKYMKRALQLAEMGGFHVSPNPAVGAVLVKNDRIIGEGFHKGSGSLHAEIEAIENSSESTEGATLYSTLEPCCSTYPGKKQPPCTERIIKEGISHVVISLKDPNHHVNGQGISQLENAGIRVTTGILTDETKSLNKVFIKNKSENLPYVHIKIAQTIDGRIATSTGHSKWITDDDARKDVHSLRSEYDAVLIGRITAEMDNPLLTVRKGFKKSVGRIVMDSRLSLCPTLKIFEDQQNNPTTVCINADETIADAKKKAFIDAGVKILNVRPNADNTLNLKDLLKQLYAEGLCSILVEGGASVFTSFVKEKLFDQMSFYVAPKICGEGKSSIGSLDISSMNESLELKRPQIRTINNQIVLTGFRI